METNLTIMKVDSGVQIDGGKWCCRGIFSSRDESNWVQVWGSDLRVRVTISFSSGGSCVGACISNAWFGTGLIVVWSRSKYGFRQLAWPNNFFPLCMSCIWMLWCLLIAWFGGGHSISVLVSGSCVGSCVLPVAPVDPAGRVVLCYFVGQFKIVWVAYSLFWQAISLVRRSQQIMSSMKESL